MVEEGLVAAEGKSNLFGEGDPDGVVRRRSEVEEKGHLSHGKNDTPIVEEGIFVAYLVAEDRAEHGLQGPFPYLAEGEALREVLDGGLVNCRVSCPCRVKVLDGIGHQHEKSLGSLCCLALKTGVPNTIVVGNDVDGDKEGSEGLSV